MKLSLFSFQQLSLNSIEDTFGVSLSVSARPSSRLTEWACYNPLFNEVIVSTDLLDGSAEKHPSYQKMAQSHAAQGLPFDVSHALLDTLVEENLHGLMQRNYLEVRNQLIRCFGKEARTRFPAFVEAFGKWGRDVVVNHEHERDFSSYRNARLIVEYFDVFFAASASSTPREILDHAPLLAVGGFSLASPLLLYQERSSMRQ
jgi:hypothetical protein